MAAKMRNEEGGVMHFSGRFFALRQRSYALASFGYVTNWCLIFEQE